jgi:hypothetical protein
MTAISSDFKAKLVRISFGSGCPDRRSLGSIGPDTALDGHNVGMVLHRLDAPDRVQDGRMVEAAEPPPYGRQAARGQLIGEVHGDMAPPHDRRLPALDFQVEYRDAEMIGGCPHDMLDGNLIVRWS